MNLIKYEAARRALEAALSVDEVKEIRDKASALQAYAKQAGDTKFLLWATEIKLRAERRAGIMLAEMKNHPPGPPSKDRSHDITDPPTLAELGITKNQSSHWQLEATISEDEFEQWLAGHQGDDFPTSSGLRNLAKIKKARQDNGPHRTNSVGDLALLAESGQKFKVIYADPPWSFRINNGAGKPHTVENHYDTMAQEDIEALGEYVEKLADDDCVLLLWAVMPQLPEALSVMQAWGFSYTTAGFSWVKENKNGQGYKFGMGHWTRSNVETCLLATRGSPTRLEKDVEQLVVAPISEHSAKPSIVHDRIERLVAGPYLEMFARKPRDNWTTWGSEITTS